ncbi:unnamed protein product [Protopolystoma xenopodis]|uniref:Uncharacterized protein n=1 Tax=Protopolystoma xenopodis TaxID=117903 RepID=A0A448XNE0_9PLAT|nr:unnamed protein product [Protopolystoma xenopodis]
MNFFTYIIWLFWSLCLTYIDIHLGSTLSRRLVIVISELNISALVAARLWVDSPGPCQQVAHVPNGFASVPPGPFLAVKPVRRFSPGLAEFSRTVVRLGFRRISKVIPNLYLMGVWRADLVLLQRLSLGSTISLFTDNRCSFGYLMVALV